MSTPVLFYWNDIQLVSQHAACKFLTDQKAVFFPVSHIENLKEIQQPMLWGGGGRALHCLGSGGPVLLPLGLTEFWELFHTFFQVGSSMG